MKHLKVAEIRGGGQICAFSALMLLVMLAPSAQAGLLYEPSNYAAQDNLVVNFDGIRNAGVHNAHDSSAVVWKNIGRVANDAELFAKSGDTSAWVADGYHFAGGAYGKLKFKQTLGASMTVQIVADVKGSENSVSWPTFFGNLEDKANIYLNDNTKGTVSFKADDSTGLTPKTRAAVTCGANVKYLNAALNANEHKQILVSSDSFATGWKEGTLTATNVVGSQYWSFGSCGADGTFNDKALGNRYLVGTIKAIRVYNKVLSDTELAANRVLDEARFFAGIPVTNVVVATAVAGLEGNEGSGAYAYDEEGYTFTAPQKATKDGTVYACAGYTLETWNGTGWSAPVRYESCAYTATDPFAKVRLTWQWRRAHAEVPVALDPLFDDYVTDGLILHLDGIRNVGADKPHDWSSSEWIDLVKGNIANIQHDDADTSTWMDDGYYFGGRSFAQFVNALSGLANMVTVQVVCDTTTNALHALKTSSDPYILWPNLVSVGDNDQLNIYYDMNGDTRGRLTFKNANGGNVNLANGAAKDAWEGRYVTAIRDNTTKKNYIIQGTSLTGAASVNAASGNISENTLRVGGANSSLDKRNQRWFLGTIKAVRIYDRVLSDAELAKNRAIDEARFFGGPLPTENVVVASSVRGVDGNEPEGVYALPDGGHTFTAPASVTVGEDSYSCTGYTLETWDGSAWSDPVRNDGVLSAALTDTTAKVRLIWQWTHTAGPGYDAAFNDYVTDGLVLHLDGIRNAGAQAAHDSGALQWADLAAKGGAARIVKETDGGEWTDDGYCFDGSVYAKVNYAVMNGTRTLDAAFTAQAIVDFDCNASHRLNTAWPGIIGTTDLGDVFALYYNQNNTGAPGVNNKVLNESSGFGISPWGGKYISTLFTGSQIAVFETSTPSTYKAFEKSPGTRTFTFASGDGSDSRYRSRRFNGTYKSARIYNRALTDEELARNRAADEVRFFGRSPAATGDLVVASAVEGLSGDQPNGAYRPAAGYTFTSQTEAVLDGVPYELKGYTLETWNGTAWADATTVQRGDAPVAVVPDVSTASKRLTWNWAVKSRLTRIPDYDVDDYVQDGLYLFYDGICNAGKDVAHDPHATEWVNLGTGGASLNAVFDYESNASAGDGWEADGYHFKYGGKFARITSNPAFGWQTTIQVVCEAETGTAPYPTMFGSTNDFLNVYSSANATLLVGKILNNRSEVKDSSGKVTTAAGGRQEMSGTWEKKYSNLDWHAGRYQVFQAIVPDPAKWLGKWRYNWTQLNNQPFYIGGVYKDGDDATYVNQRRFAGKIQAIRVYNRSLSDEELEQNRKVDEARFKGNPPEWNVTIDTKYGHGVGETLAEGVGNYKVEGTYTFSAKQVKDSKDEIKPVEGYYLEKYVNDAWTPKEWNPGNEFTYTEGAKVRVTWGPKRKGMTLVIR